MSSVAICALLTRIGYSPVLQISCRDYNRIAIQGNVLGAAALGVCNVLCLTGDGVQSGDHPEAKPVFDLDSISLLKTHQDACATRSASCPAARSRRRRGFFLGAAENPFAPPFDFRPLRLAKKVAAGAQFIQTQYCFDVPMLRALHGPRARHRARRECFILVGVGPLASAKTARWMRAHVPGVHIPDEVIERLEGATDQKAEGKRLCIELIQEIREIKGVAGVHVMAYRQEEYVSEIVHESGVLKGRLPWNREFLVNAAQRAIA